MDSSVEKRMVTLQRNPLLINEIINCVFEYLLLEDLKQCRGVCQQWNSESLKILKKQSRIKLDSKDRIAEFIEFFKAEDTRAFPFTTFHLEFTHTDGNIEEFYEQLKDFFNTLRENIITVTFQDNRLYGDRLCLTPLIGIATNLVSLTLSSLHSVVAFDKLSKVKYLSLALCDVSLDSFENRIAPLSILLHSVRFERNENALQEILINDYIDFGRCSEITIMSEINPVMTFDMSRDIVSAQKVVFFRTRVINWRETTAKLNKKMIPFENHSGMKIKQLFFSRSEFNVSVLPKSIEKVALFDVNTYDTNKGVPVDLPNLKCLFLHDDANAKTAIMSPTAYNMGITTSFFRRCPKLVDLELSGFGLEGGRCDINVDLLPVNLKRIKLKDNEKINLVGDSVTHVDILILEIATFVDAQRCMNKIKPKIVVVELACNDVEDPSNEVVSFVEESRNLEKVVIKIPDFGDSEVLQSYERTLSGYVQVEDDGIASKCYEFTSQVGKCLTRKEFKMYWFKA